VKTERDNDTQQEASGTAPAPVALTYQMLLNKFLEGLDGPAKAGRLWAFNLWIENIQVVPEDWPGVELGSEFEGSLTRIRDRLAATKSAKTSANFSSHIRAFQALYLSVRENDALPTKLSQAICVRLKDLGLALNSVHRSVAWSAYRWAQGVANPDNSGGALKTLHKLEDYLQLSRGTLVSRSIAHCPSQSKGRQLNTDIPYRRHHKLLIKHLYTLKKEDAPLELQNALDALVTHKQKRDHVLLNDEPITLEAKETWNSADTVSMRLLGFYRFFGFLALPKSQRPLSQLSWEEQIDFGYGLPKESLRFTMLFNKEYIRAYLDYVQLRTFDVKALLYEEAKANGNPIGSPPLRRTLPSVVDTFLTLIINLVGKNTGFLRLHPEYASEVGVSPDAWQDWCLAKYEDFKKIRFQASKKIERNKRSVEASVGELLRDKNPLEEIHNLVDALRSAPPPETSTVALRAHHRDITLFSFLIFDPLRLKNIHQLELGVNVKQDSLGRWTLELDASNFKNFIHGHAESRYRLLPEEVVEDLMAWLEVRKGIPGIGKTKQLFVNINSNNQRKLVSSKATIHRIIRRHTFEYFGVGLGPHILRHLNATAIARHAGPAQVKAILNDSEAVAMAVYDHAINQDQNGALTDLYHQLRPTSTRKKGAK
jgi:hypothetical protein